MYKWTLPIVGEEQPGNFQFAYLALPGRFITEEEYKQMVKMIELFRLSLIVECYQKQDEKRVIPAFWNFVKGK